MRRFHRRERRRLGLLFATSLVWGTTWIPNEYLAGQGTPCALAALRYVLASAILAAIASIRALLKHRAATDQATIDLSSSLEVPPGQRARSIQAGCTLGLSMFAVPVLLMNWTAHHGAGAWTPALYAGLPLGLSIVAGELQVPAIIGFGAMFLLLNGSLPLTALKLAWALPTLGAVVLQGWSLLYARRRLSDAASLSVIALQFGVAGLALGLAACVWEAPPRLAPPVTWHPSALASLGALTVLATILAYPLYYGLLRNLEPAQLTVSQWLQTLIAAGEGAWLLRQRPGSMMAGAAATLSVCSWLLLQPSSRRPSDLRSLYADFER